MANPVTPDGKDDIITEQRFTVVLRHWGAIDTDPEDVMLALQDAVAPGGRLYAPPDAEIEGIYVTREGE